MTAKAGQIKEMSAAELQLRQQELEKEQSDLQRGLRKLQLANVGALIVLLALFLISAWSHAGFLTDKYFWVISGILEAALLTRFIFAFRQEQRIRKEIREIKAELSTR